MVSRKRCGVQSQQTLRSALHLLSVGCARLIENGIANSRRPGDYAQQLARLPERLRKCRLLSGSSEAIELDAGAAVRFPAM
jgi:hypothetical protein